MRSKERKKTSVEESSEQGEDGMRQNLIMRGTDREDDPKGPLMRAPMVTDLDFNSSAKENHEGI